MTHHCEHGHYYGNDNWDADCCICCGTPCGKVTVEICIAHETGEIDGLRKSHEHDIAYVLKHGEREAVPF